MFALLVFFISFTTAFFLLECQNYRAIQEDIELWNMICSLKDEVKDLKKCVRECPN